MPTVVQTATTAETYLSLAQAVLREAGENTVSTFTGATDRVEALKEHLNDTVRDIYNLDPDWWFKEADWYFAPQDGVAYRSLPTNFERIHSGPRDVNRKLRFMPPPELDEKRPDQTQEGTPLYFYLWLDRLYLSHIPDSGYAAKKSVAGTDGNYYVCDLGHDATTDDKPITGANYATYWSQDTGLTDAETWVEGTTYKNDPIRMRYFRIPTEMASENDNPDVPTSYLELVKIGALARYKAFREDDDADQTFGKYLKMQKDLERVQKQVSHGHKIRMYR